MPVHRVVDRVLDRRAVIGGTSATAVGHCSGLGVERVAVHDLVDQSGALGGKCVKGRSAQQELLGLARAEFPGLDEQLDADATHAGDGVRELGIVGRHDEIAHRGEHQAGGATHPLDRGDRDLADSHGSG